MGRASHSGGIHARRLAGAGLMLAVLVAVAYLAICAHVASRLTQPFRRTFTHVPEHFGLAYESVSFPSRVDALRLDGWLLAPMAGPTARRPVVVVHGWAKDRQSEVEGRILEIAARLVHQGHWVLLFDLRGWGRSEGERFTLGAHEVWDVGGAVDFLRTRGLAADGVNLLGYSMGAAACMLLAPTEPLVRAVAEDSGYAELSDVLEEQVSKHSGLPRLFTAGTVFMAGLLIGADPHAIRPIARMPLLRTGGVPLLVIHGEADDLVLPSHGRRLAAAYGPGAETLFVPGAEHVLSYAVEPAAYMARLVTFFARAEAGLLRGATRHAAPSGVTARVRTALRAGETRIAYPLRRAPGAS